MVGEFRKLLFTALESSADVSCPASGIEELGPSIGGSTGISAFISAIISWDASFAACIPSSRDMLLFGVSIDGPELSFEVAYAYTKSPITVAININPIK